MAYTVSLLDTIFAWWRKGCIFPFILRFVWNLQEILNMEHTKTLGELPQAPKMESVATLSVATAFTH